MQGLFRLWGNRKPSFSWFSWHSISFPALWLLSFFLHFLANVACITTCPSNEKWIYLPRGQLWDGVSLYKETLHTYVSRNPLRNAQERLLNFPYTKQAMNPLQCGGLTASFNSKKKWSFSLTKKKRIPFFLSLPTVPMLYPPAVYLPFFLLLVRFCCNMCPPLHFQWRATGLC